MIGFTSLKIDLVYHKISGLLKIWVFLECSSIDNNLERPYVFLHEGIMYEVSPNLG